MLHGASGFDEGPMPAPPCDTRMRANGAASMKPSNIQWTGYTINFWTGCSKVSAGCRNCYMYRESERWGKDAQTLRRTNNSTFYGATKLNGEQTLFVLVLGLTSSTREPTLGARMLGMSYEPRLSTRGRFLRTTAEYLG